MDPLEDSHGNGTPLEEDLGTCGQEQQLATNDPAVSRTSEGLRWRPTTGQPGRRPVAGRQQGEETVTAVELCVLIQPDLDDAVPILAYKIHDSLLLTPKWFIQVKQNWYQPMVSSSFLINYGIIFITQCNWELPNLYNLIT